MPEPTESERRRLCELYAQMDQGELEDLAREAPLLSPPAREILRQEIARRNLNIELETRPIARDEIEYRPLVTIGTFRDLPEALLAKGRLEAAGIESFTGNENIVRMDWFWSNAVGGIKLKVKLEDAESALEILQQPTQDFELDEQE